MRRCLPLVLFACLSACGGAAATGSSSSSGPGAKPGLAADISSVRDQLSVFDAGQGHYIALVEPDAENPTPPQLMLFWGDGKVFYAAPVDYGQADGLKFDIAFEDARVASSPAGTVKRERGKTELECWGEHTPLTALAPDAAKAMVAGARFEKNGSEWSPVALGHDGDHYLYVDTGFKGAHLKTYRVFDGKKGSMKELQVSEAGWDKHENTLTLKTSDGVVLVERDKNQQTEYTLKPWFRDKKIEFSSLPRGANWHLVFEQLGVYPERLTPTPCDLAMK